MRGDVVHLVYGVHAGRDADVYFGGHRTEEAARAHIRELETRQMHGASWAAQYHDLGFVVRPAVVHTDFEINTSTGFVTCDRDVDLSIHTVMRDPRVLPPPERM